MLFAFRHFAMVRPRQNNYYSAVNKHHVVRDCVPLRNCVFYKSGYNMSIEIYTNNK